MYADYTSGMSFSALGRKYELHRKTLPEIFARRGLALRPAPVPRLGFGVRIPEATPAEIDAAVAGLKRLSVPVMLRQEWKRSPLSWRRAMVRTMRERFPSRRPKGPFSRNVMPFEYGTPAAHALAARLNAGRNSRTKAVAIKPCSEGVIWRDRLYFWAFDSYVAGCRWTPEHGRPLLSHLVWAEANGRPVPERHLVIHRDGNKNNFAPSNLALMTMAENAIRNKDAGRARRGEAAARTLIEQFNRGGKTLAAQLRSKYGDSKP